MQSEDFIFEIGVEEIPARYIPVFEKEMETCWLTIAQENLLTYGTYTIIASPRRVGIYVQSLERTQGVRRDEVVGPPASIAWSDGSPTPALTGFLKKYNAPLDDIYTKETTKGAYIAFMHTSGGNDVIDILSSICQEIIHHLSSIQKMRWGDSTVVFARPLVSLIALYGSIPIHVEYGACKTATPQYTYGHRILCNHQVVISDAQSYFKTMEESMVIPLFSERKRRIEDAITSLEASYDATIIRDELLIEENANLCEYPHVIVGDIDARYLDLPREVILTTLQSHQRSFGLADSVSHKLLPHFITVTNNPHGGERIQQGWEKVVRARLEDAMFFYRMDKESSFETWIDNLDDVTFISSLGSMRERSLRINALAVHIAHLINPELEIEAGQAGKLCKADLMSAVVKEFDTLQGIMGGVYAREKGKGEAIAIAIAEHYLPIGPSSPLPSTLLGSIVALADKIDMVVGCFSMNMIPTGTTDPQGVRRAVLGIVRIMLGYNLRFDFQEIILHARHLYGERDWKLREDEMIQQLSQFFAIRMKQYFLSLGFDTICIDAVLGIEDSLPALFRRIEALQDFIKGSYAKEVSMVFKRLSNIVEQERVHDIVTEHECNPSLFQHDAERELHDVLLSLLPILRKALKEEEYGKVLEEAQKLYEPLQYFFDSVLVLDNDNAIRTNRILLLQSILCVLEQIADFKQLQL